MQCLSFKEIAYKLGHYHSCQKPVKGAAIDSRKVQPGNLFFALPGNRVDGHYFLQEAELKGAVGAVVNENFQSDRDWPLIKVPDVLLALQDLARQNLQERPSKVIAITGSLGKTTTKGFIAELLKSRYKVFSSPLSYNSQATLPLSILMAEGSEDFLILEMGMSEPGNLKRLISIAPPDIALLTTVAMQHVTSFSDGLLGIALEKGAIFSHSKTTLGILPHNLPFFNEILNSGVCKKVTFSSNADKADYQLNERAESIFIQTPYETSPPLKLNLPNKVHHHNVLAAIVLARRVDIPWSDIQKIAPTLKLPPMRFEPLEREGILFINDAYNANPDSITGALENLPAPAANGKVIAVLSEMDALGAYSEEGHQRVGQVALAHADHLLCLGARCEIIKKIWDKNQKPISIFNSREELGVALKKLARQGDVVLLKGARSYALDQILQLFN